MQNSFLNIEPFQTSTAPATAPIPDNNSVVGSSPPSVDGSLEQKLADISQNANNILTLVQDAQTVLGTQGGSNTQGEPVTPVPPSVGVPEEPAEGPNVPPPVSVQQQVDAPGAAFRDVLGPNDEEDDFEDHLEEGFTNLGSNSHVSNLLKAVLIALLVCLLRNNKVKNMVVNNLQRLLPGKVSPETIVCVLVGVLAYVVLMVL